MADSTIGIDLDLVMQNLQTLVGLGDVIPPANEVSVANGLASGPGEGYYARLTQRGLDLAKLVSDLRAQLEGAQDAIKATVDQFVAQDAAQADIAQTLLASIESMSATDKPTTTSTAPATTTSPGSDDRTALG